MSLTLKIKDPGRIAKNLIARNRKFRQAVRTNFVLAGETYISFIRQKYYSGRKGDNTGLNKITGFAYRSWFSDVKEIGIDIVGTIYPGAMYVIYHEKEGGMHPKRTSVKKDFYGHMGQGLYSNAVQNAMTRAF